MTTGFLTLKTTGGEVQEAIEIAISALDDLSPLFELIHPSYLANAKRMYASAGFGTWPTYEQAEGPQYPTVKGIILGWDMTAADLLRWDWKGGRERLYPSMTEAGHTHNVADIQPRHAEFGTDAPGALNHERGTGTGPKWGGSKPVPQRQLTLTDRRFLEDVQEATSQFAGFVAQSFGRTTVGMTSADVVSTVSGARGFGFPTLA